MAMRVEIAFPRPLPRAQRLHLTVVLGALARTDRVRFAGGDRVAVVHGEGLALAAVREALAQEGFPGATLTTSLAEEEDQRLAEPPPEPGHERVKPLGR